MKIKNLTMGIVLGGILFLLSHLSAYAGFGVSPTNISNEYLKPGGSFEEEITLSRSESLEEMNITIEPDLKEIDTWFTFEPGKIFKFEKGATTKTFRVKVNVPDSAQYKNYQGVIRVSAVGNNLTSGGISVTQGVRLDINLTVTKQDVTKLSVLSVKAFDSTKEGKVKIDITAKNMGNVDVSPVIKVTILNLLMEKLEEHIISDFGFIKPNETKTLTAEFVTKLPAGEYFIEAEVLSEGIVARKERMVFNVIGSGQQEETTDKPNTVLGTVQSIFKSMKENLLPISIAALVVLAGYILIGKMWEMKGLVKSQNRWWAKLLGSKKFSRMFLSFFLGLEVLLLLIFYPLVIKISDHIQENEYGETQGVQDSTVKRGELNVIPKTTPLEYLVYERADTNSEVLYKAKENETFVVVKEEGDWYKVKLSNGSYGWLQKSIVKSVDTKE